MTPINTGSLDVLRRIRSTELALQYLDSAHPPAETGLIAVAAEIEKFLVNGAADKPGEEAKKA